MTKLTTKIEKVVYGGKGLGTDKNKKVFINNTFTGDEVSYEILKDHSSFQEGAVLSYLKKSPARRASPCIYSEKCGGCQWINIKEDKQLEAKQGFIKESLERIGGLSLKSKIKINSSEDILNYRNRILLRGTYAEGKVKVGFFEEGSHTQIHIDECKIAHQAHNDLIEYINGLDLKEARSQKFRLEAQVLPSAFNEKKPCLLLLLVPVEKKHKLHDLYNALKKYPGTLSISYQNVVKKVEFSLFEESNGLSYYTQPRIFQQVNTKANHSLRNKVKQIVEEINPKTILDLYCGSGNLSLGLAQEERKIYGIELSKKSIQVANFNVKSNSLEGFNYKSGNVRSFLKEQIETESFPFDLVIVDPPRKGAKEEIEGVLKLKPKHVLYVSCDPTTLARDYKTLSTNYKIKHIEGFDFFPQTYHVETLLLLEEI